MKKLLISAFVASMFAGGHAFAGENIPLAAALGSGAAVTVTAAGAVGGGGLGGAGTQATLAVIAASTIAVLSKANGKSATSHP